MDVDARLLIRVPLRVMAISAGYAAALSLLERHLRLKPDHEWVEVAIGVGLTLVPVAIEAHRIEGESKASGSDNEPIDWKTYEGAVWRSFMASGAPIIFWQIAETLIRKWELMGYLTGNTTRRSPADVNTAAQVAYRSREPAERSAAGGSRGTALLARGPGKN